MLSHRATHVRRFTLLAVPLLVAASLTVVIASTTPASGQSGGASTSTLPNAGVLRLHLGATDEFRFQVPAPSPAGQYVDTTPPTTQSVGISSGCRLSLGAGGLAELTASGGSVGFVGDAIGVRGPGEGNGQPCGRIDGSQLLAMRLMMPGKAIDFAEIDIEGKFDAKLEVNGYFIDADDSCSSPPATTLMKSETYDLTTGSDSGPDSGDGDNYRLRFPENVEDKGNLVAVNTAVNCLTFEVVTGGVSLEGGSDGTEPCDTNDGCIEPSLGQTIDDTATLNTFTSDSLFHLIEADGVLACGGFADLTEAGITSHVERLDNIGGGCGAAIPYDQASSTETTVCNPDPEGQADQCTFFRKDLLGQQAQFYWTVTWAAADETYMPHDTQFDFGDGRGYVDAQFCLADGTNGDPDGFPDLPPSAGAPATGPFDPYCVLETHSVLQGDGRVVVTERYYGQLDPGSRR